MHRSLPWLAAASLALLVAALTPHRHWDPDEFEHAQVAWLIGQGLIPFADFFEHHTPLWHHLAAIPASWLGVPTAPAGPMAFLVGARFVSLAASIATVALTWAFARRLADPSAASIAAALLASASFFILNGMEVRPDPLAVLGLVATSYALARSAASAHRGWALAAGIAYGLAVMASQKAICAAPGLAIAFLWVSAGRHGTSTTWLLAAIAAVAALLATLPVLAWFAARGALDDFFAHTVIANLYWTCAQDHMVWHHLKAMIRHDAVLGLLAVIGAIGLARHRRGAMILVPLTSLAIGAVALPVVQEQYFVMALPYAAIAAGWAAVRLHRPLTTPAARIGVAIAAALLLLATTARNLHTAFDRDNGATRAKLAYLLATVPPEATVMGGWSPGVAFRLPAWRYFFLHSEIQTHIPASAYGALAESLRTGQVRPEVIDFDAAMTELPPAVRAEIHRLYAPTGVGTLLRRR